MSLTPPAWVVARSGLHVFILYSSFIPCGCPGLICHVEARRVVRLSPSLRHVKDLPTLLVTVLPLYRRGPAYPGQQSCPHEFLGASVALGWGRKNDPLLSQDACLPVRDRAPYPFTDRTRPPGGRSKSTLMTMTREKNYFSTPISRMKENKGVLESPRAGLDDRMSGF